MRWLRMCFFRIFVLLFHPHRLFGVQGDPCGIKSFQAVPWVPHVLAAAPAGVAPTNHVSSLFPHSRGKQDGAHHAQYRCNHPRPSRGGPPCGPRGQRPSRESAARSAARTQGRLEADLAPASIPSKTAQPSPPKEGMSCQSSSQHAYCNGYRMNAPPR